MTVSELVEKMDSNELTYWMMYSELQREEMDARAAESKNKLTVGR